MIKTFVMLQKITFQINAVHLNSLFIKMNIIHYNNNNKCFLVANQNIRMITEGSCNDAKKISVEITGIINYILNIYSNRKQSF